MTDTEAESDTNPPSTHGDRPLGQAAEAAKNGDPALEDTLRRIAPHDGSRVLLVAASFNSAI